MSVTFQSKLLDLPTNSSSTDLSEVVIDSVVAIDAQLGKDLDAIFNYMINDKSPLVPQIVNNCDWNAKTKSFN